MEKKKAIGIASLTAIVGTLVGAAAGILLAPRSGLATRDRLHFKVDNAADNVRLACRKTAAKAKRCLLRKTE